MHAHRLFLKHFLQVLKCALTLTNVELKFVLRQPGLYFQELLRVGELWNVFVERLVVLLEAGHKRTCKEEAEV